MLTLFFKEILTLEQDVKLHSEFKEYPTKFEYEVNDCKEKVSFFVNDEKIAQEKVDKISQIGLEFVTEYHDGESFFHDGFLTKKETEEQLTNNTTEPMNIEMKPLVSTRTLNNAPEAQGPPPSPQNATPPPPVLDTKDLLEQIRKMNETQFTSFANTLQNQFSSNFATLQSLTPPAPALASSSSVPRPPQMPYTPTLPQMHAAPVRSAPPAEYKAKNELIANGMKCEKCNFVVKGIEPITKLIQAVRDHVMTHFDSECPLLKRFECRQCPEFKTNFVDDFEHHLKRHGSMVSLPEKRKQLTVNLLTETHLKTICQLCSVCFPDVFEKTPPSINTILAVDTPLKAKASVFPPLDRVYCRRFNIPYSCVGRGSLPVPLVRLD